jgi:hypothetical protein
MTLYQVKNDHSNRSWRYAVFDPSNGVERVEGRPNKSAEYEQESLVALSTCDIISCLKRPLAAEIVIQAL